MAYSNNVHVEFMVPSRPGVAERIHDFYGELGWQAIDLEGSPRDTFVSPRVGNEPDLPYFSYWQTENSVHTDGFVWNEDPVPSEYALGWRLSELQQRTEVVLTVPHNDAVLEIYRRGGALMVAHAHIAPRMHAGRMELRMSDPFYNALRIAAPSTQRLPFHEY